MRVTENMKQKIDRIIASPLTNWTEKDRQLLEQTDDDILDKMLPAEDAEDVIQNIATSAGEPLDLPTMNWKQDDEKEEEKQSRRGEATAPLDVPKMF
ncbi:MAG: hypothetical protein C0397_19480 [Odoribacter sp.]|nr:hypothetical protein [Odoribacter sp.]